MPFLPKDFKVPERAETEEFIIRHITIHDVVKDYEAVMTSRDYLWSLFGEAWGWPTADLSFEQDLIDLGWHQKEGQLRKAFDFAVFNKDESKLMGCLYLDPPEKKGYDVDVYYWIRSMENQQNLEERLFAFAQEWIKTNWPFDKPAFPGRLISWKDWDLLE